MIEIRACAHTPRKRSWKLEPNESHLGILKGPRGYKNKSLGSYSLKFDGFVYPFGHQVLIATAMDSYNSVLGSD